MRPASGRRSRSVSPAWLVDAAASWKVAQNVEAIFAVENLADSEFEVGRTPIPTIGLPRSLFAGARIALRR